MVPAATDPDGVGTVSCGGECVSDVVFGTVPEARVGVVVDAWAPVEEGGGNVLELFPSSSDVYLKRRACWALELSTFKTYSHQPIDDSERLSSSNRHD